MQTNIIQQIDNCLKNKEIGPLRAGSISVYPIMQCLENLLQDDPDFPEVNYALGKYHKAIGDSEIGEEYFKKVKNLLPSNKSRIDKIIEKYYGKM